MREKGKLIVPESVTVPDYVEGFIADRKGWNKDELIEKAVAISREAAQKYFKGREEFKRRLAIATALPEFNDREQLARFLDGSLQELDAAVCQTIEGMGEAVNLLIIQIQQRGRQPDQAQKDEIWDRYHGLNGRDRQTAPQIAKALDIDESAVRQALKRMKREGRKALDKRRRK